jgi:hypothetical protein
MMKAGFFAVLILWGIVAAGYAAAPEELLGGERAAALKAGEKMSEVQFKDPRPRLAPKQDELLGLLEKLREELDPSLMAETLSLYKKPEGAAKPAWSAGERLNLYNAALALSTLEGIQYYSASRKTMRTFYESSWVIDGPGTKNPVEDPVYGTLPTELSLYARQRDLTFGDNIYQYTYYAFPALLVFVQQNLSSMNAGIIPAVGKNRLRSLVALIDAGDYLLIYAVSMAKAVSLPGLGERIGNSFTNRAEAVLEWFRGQAAKALLGTYP